MPGWHQATEKLQKDGKLQMVGIIQEQHPDRCRLFMQWKRMGWPILVDSLNLYGIEVVPLTYAIDEHGIVRFVKPAPEQIEQFVNTSYEKPAELPRQPDQPCDLNGLKTETRAGTMTAWRAYGDGLFLWGGQARLGETIHAYQQALRLDPQDSISHFRLGVAYRRRYDSDFRQPDDFQKAVEHWTHAVDINPNQYIWRRRVQQYGPRLVKPYSFYDWVDLARHEIRARGEVPVNLAVEPGGAELISPAKEFSVNRTHPKDPDPKGRVARDTQELILVESAVVPPVIKPGEASRVHLVLRPNIKRKAHWNNEVEPLGVWVSSPQGWVVDSQYLTVPNPKAALSSEMREVQFEIRSSETASLGTLVVPSRAYYYVCEDVNGVCLYRRQDIRVSVTIRK